jgi:hypothetical protein
LSAPPGPRNLQSFEATVDRVGAAQLNSVLIDDLESEVLVVELKIEHRLKAEISNFDGRFDLNVEVGVGFLQMGESAIRIPERSLDRSPRERAA